MYLSSTFFYFSHPPMDPFSDSFIHKMHYDHAQDLFILVNSISTKHFRQIHTRLRDAKQSVSQNVLIPEYGITVGDLFLYTFFDKIKKTDHEIDPSENSDRTGACKEASPDAADGNINSSREVARATSNKTKKPRITKQPKVPKLPRQTKKQKV